MAEDPDADAEEQLPEVSENPPEEIIDVEPRKKTENVLAPPKYDVRPDLGEKFQAAAVQEIIQQSMQQQLLGRQYRADQAAGWAERIANGVRSKVEELNMKRYKIVVQTTLFEMKGAGIKCGQRMIWDPETDAYTADLYRNDSLACFTLVYGVYMY